MSITVFCVYSILNYYFFIYRKTLSIKDSAWTKFISSVRARLNVAKIVEEVKSDATLSFDFIILLIVASILAAFGLVEDNTLFLAASMLISPLMGPIMVRISFLFIQVFCAISINVYQRNQYF